MPPPRKLWIRIDIGFTTHPKLVGLSSDRARWGWLHILEQGKQQRPGGVFASLAHLRAISGQYARHVPEYQRVELLDAPTPTGVIGIHDWRRYQWDPTNAERQGRHRNADGDADVTSLSRDSNGERNAPSRAREETETETVLSPPESPPLSNGDPDPLELAVDDALAPRTGSLAQHQTMRRLADQLGESSVIGALERAMGGTDAYGTALRELKEQANRPRRRHQHPPGAFDAMVQRDEPEVPHG